MWTRLSGPDLALPSSTAKDSDIALIEGVMGLFDGADVTSEIGSTAEIAKWLGAPVLLVMDAAGMSRSAAGPDSTNSRGVTKGRSATVVQAAYALIVEKGFEGLRTRDVAERVGMNSATLHYYFPTKEALIQGVVHHLMQELQTSRATADDSAGALEMLRAEFADIRIRLKEAPDQLVVLTELAVRAWRDPAIAGILSYLDQGWHDHLVSILQAGVAEKTFRSDLDLEATANSMMSQLRGIGYQSKLDHAKLDALVDQIGMQIERWVLAPMPPKPRQKRT